MDSAPVVKSAARAIQVLELLAASDGGRTLLQLAEKLEAPKSSVHMLLSTLVERHVVVTHRSPNGTVYALGHRVFEIGQAYARSVDLVRDGNEAVRELSEQCAETAHLAALDGTEIVYLAKQEGPQAVRMVSAVGRRFPAHGTGVGKVLLAGLTDATLADMYPDGTEFSASTPKTITDAKRLQADIRKVRERGLAHDVEESSLGLSCVAAPVYDSANLVAAMSVSAPTARLPEEKGDEFASILSKCARDLSTRLGCSTYPATISPGSTKFL